MMFNRQHLEMLQATVCSLLLLFFVFGVVSAWTVTTPQIASAQSTDGGDEGGGKDEPSVLGFPSRSYHSLS